ncbi:arginine repressor [Anaerotalea alkaliphila]|uniref:Arginine repressor n=1 Tax=Anaerotalea alkaliphila TaxID=2662126 RepID=A0A7X5HTC5_9FIRM|nr:arginine repressor [Anaerotalea alkaliphila]NDL66264.1 arginine repressor [Anaerotalea alkaliphila]
MKIERQTKILQLVNEQEVETQEELAALLTAAGYDVTQATISRDIRDLKLTKVNLASGRQKYAVMPHQDQGINEKYIRILRDGYLSMDRAGNMIVLKTLTGMAMAVAAAIDSLDFYEVVGCIAGDDTIFCAVRTEKDAIPLMERLHRIIQE